MEDLCGRDRAVVNRLEALLEKHLQERFKSKDAELLSVSLSFWREGEICAHGSRQSTVPGPSRAEVEVVARIGVGSPSTLPIGFWGQWKCQDSQSLLQALQTHFHGVSAASISSATFDAADCSNPGSPDAAEGRCCDIGGHTCSIPTLQHCETTSCFPHCDNDPDFCFGVGTCEEKPCSSTIAVKVQFQTMDFEIKPDVCASEKGEGEEIIEVVGDVLGEHYHDVEYHCLTDGEMNIPTFPLGQTNINSRRLQPFQYSEIYSDMIKQN